MRIQMRNPGCMRRCRGKQLPQSISPNRVWKVISTHRPMLWPQVIRESRLWSIWLSTVVTLQGQLLQLCSPFATFSDMVQISHDAGEATRATLNTGERDQNYSLRPVTWSLNFWTATGTQPSLHTNWPSDTIRPSSIFPIGINLSRPWPNGCPIYQQASYSMFSQQSIN